MRRALQRLLISLSVLVLGTRMICLSRGGDPNSLDCAWQGLLQHDWNHGARFGVDTVFTYGPTGYLLAASMFDPQGLWSRTLLGNGLALAMAASLASLARWLPGRAWRVVYLLGLLALTPFLKSSLMYLVISVLGVCSAMRLLPGTDAAATGAAPAPRATWSFFAAAMLMLAVAGLAKFTYLVFGSATVA